MREANQELEAFSYSVSHDLRAPLAAIGGFSKALAEKLGSSADEKAHHYLARIQAGALRMEQLIEALLGLSRFTRAPLDLVPVDLSLLAQESVEALQAQHPTRCVQVAIEKGLGAVGDHRLLRALMDNLVGNAWKFTSQAPAARIDVGRDTAHRAFFVRDNGVGFDIAQADKLFSAFQRFHAEREFPGTGIGLAIVRRIVARHGGRVWAESSPGAGTTLYFTLGD
jgi:light-regulated signal transduction histidine kinase (bacteriophytochrome)